MKEMILDNRFTSSINFFDNILFLDSFENDKKVYNMAVDYFKRENDYLLKLNVIENDKEIINTECRLANKINGSIVIKDIITMVTTKYHNDLVVDVKEIDKDNKCIKFGRRTYNGKN